MAKVFAVIVAAAMLSSDGVSSSLPMASDEIGFANASAGAFTAAALDVPALLNAARGAPPMICALAARSVSGWGGGYDAPSTPLGRDVFRQLEDRSNLTEADVETLLQSLSSDDPCVRELSVRLVARRGNQRVSQQLTERLASPSAPVREIAAFGLGVIEYRDAIDPLIRALRDDAAGVRANSAWALGKIETGRALTPIMSIVGDREEIVREAAVVALGHIDSTRSAATLARVLRQDESPRVRRVAAWALGELESREGVEPLSASLSQDSDARVREMSAWALGNIESSAATAALLTAARRDADDKVRETAVWALAQIEDPSSADALASIAGSDRNPRVRGTAAWALGNLRDDTRTAPAALMNLLKDESEDTRLKAAWALGQIQDSAALPAIKAALRVEKSEDVNKALIRALIRSGERSTGTLTDLLESSDPRVREAAVRGLAGRRQVNPWPWPWPRPRPMP